MAKENISFTNDAASFLRSEKFCGAATCCERVIGITFGTGLGSAIHNGNHTWDANLWCSPFLDGVAEDYFSSKWFKILLLYESAAADSYMYAVASGYFPRFLNLFS